MLCILCLFKDTFSLGADHMVYNLWKGIFLPYNIFLFLGLAAGELGTYY